MPPLRQDRCEPAHRGGCAKFGSCAKSLQPMADQKLTLPSPPHRVCTASRPRYVYVTAISRRARWSRRRPRCGRSAPNRDSGAQDSQPFFGSSQPAASDSAIRQQLEGAVRSPITPKPKVCHSLQATAAIRKQIHVMRACSQPYSGVQPQLVLDGHAPVGVVLGSVPKLVVAGLAHMTTAPHVSPIAAQPKVQQPSDSTQDQPLQTTPVKVADEAPKVSVNGTAAALHAAQSKKLAAARVSDSAPLQLPLSRIKVVRRGMRHADHSRP